jgi:hypothetical protein
MPDIDTTQVVCVAEVHAIEGKTDELIAALHVLIKPTHAEGGCLRYELNQRTDEPRWVTFIEKWTPTVPCHTSRITSTTCVPGWLTTSR